MKILNYKDNSEIKKDVKPLYLKAFPKDERPPAVFFFRNNAKPENNIFAYYDENEFIGFTQLTFYKDIVCVFFLAVSESKRNQGYGTKILTNIKETYPNKVIMLCYEEVDEKYADYDNRLKRRNFYRKNDFQDNEMKSNEFGVVFESGYFGSHKVSFEDYVEIFVLGFGGFVRDYIKRG